MKTKLLLAALVASLISISASAEGYERNTVASFSAPDETPTTPKIGCPARGYRGFVDVGLLAGKVDGGLLDGKIDDAYEKVDYGRFALTTTHGFQINPHIFVGLGLGFQFNMEDDLIEDLDALVLPYSAVRYDILARRISPFVEARIGGFVSASAQENMTMGGASISFNAGVRLRRFNFSIGYEALVGTYKTDLEGIDLPEEDVSVSSFSLRFGVDIGRRK